MLKLIFFFTFAPHQFRSRDVAQPGSALAWGARGRWFESSRPDQQKARSESCGFCFSGSVTEWSEVLTCSPERTGKQNRSDEVGTGLLGNKEGKWVTGSVSPEVIQSSR